MKTKFLRRLSATIISVSILLSLSISSLAASPGLSNFQPVNTYQPGQFTDVASSDWFAPNVELSYEVGILKGTSDTFFNAAGNVTLAEAVTMACRLNSIYRFGSESFTQGSPWYQCYVDYALGTGILTQSYSNYNAPATRAQFADIFSRAFPDGALSEKNQIQDGSIPDVPASSPYYDGIYALYRAGILAGYDAEGTFLPDKNLLRSEASAFVSRMVDESLRQSFSLGTVISYYDQDPAVPDFGAIAGLSPISTDQTKNSHTYTYYIAGSSLNFLTDWRSALTSSGFTLLRGENRDGGYANVYEKADLGITLSEGVENYNYYFVEIEYEEDFDTPSISTPSDLADYLNDYYGQIKTPLGTYDVSTSIKVNNSSYNLYDWWIMSDMNLSATLFYDLEYSISITQQEKEQTLAALRQYQEEIYKIAAENFPDKKLAGGFYSGYYQYPHLQVGYHSIQALSWMNYEPSDYIGILEDYHDSSITSFHWTPDHDDYDFSEI